METNNILDFFPSRNFLIEVNLDNTNEEAATKLLESVVKGEELIHGLKITKIYPKVATIENIEKTEARKRIDTALDYLDDVKNTIEEAVKTYKNEEFTSEEFGVIQKFKQF